MAIPLGNLNSIAIRQIHENIQFVVEVIEDDNPGPGLANIQHFLLSARIRIDHLTQQRTILTGSLNRLVLPRIPACFANILVLLLVEIHINCLVVLNRWPLEVHIHQNSITQPDKPGCVDVPINFRELREPRVDDMLVFELCPILVESVCNEYRNIICPAIAWRSTQQDPVILFCDLQE